MVQEEFSEFFHCLDSQFKLIEILPGCGGLQVLDGFNESPQPDLQLLGLLGTEVLGLSDPGSFLLDVSTKCLYLKQKMAGFPQLVSLDAYPQKIGLAVKDLLEQVDPISIPGLSSIFSEFLVGQEILQLQAGFLIFLPRTQEVSCEKQ
jgi:hypothetical protein